MTLQEIIQSDDLLLKKALFQFENETNKEILLKFNVWARFFFISYFSSNDAKFHKGMDLQNIRAYRGEINSFTNLAFRGSGKTSRTKLFIAYCIANDIKRSRKYIKILAADTQNSKQMVTDIYNMLINPAITQMYPELFAKTIYKKEETMNSFTTATDVKVLASTVGTDQRGSLQQESRPDLILFDDYENRSTLRSAVKTKAIFDNMEEARTSLSIDGSCIYLGNYISEAGNVHKLVLKENEKNVVSIIPIMTDDGAITWNRYTKEDVEQMKSEDDDFEGERLCKPSSSRDVLFDRDTLDNMPLLAPIRDVAGFKIYKEYDASHRYGSGHDVAGGVGLDSSTSVFIDFSTVPANVVATFHNNIIKPDTLGDEINRQSNLFGGNLVAIEKNNHGHTTIARCRQLGVNLYKTQRKETKIGHDAPTEYGWQTNGLTKSSMLFSLKKAIEDGLLLLNDKDLIQEVKGYTRNDLMDNEIDPRLATRHSDLLIACCIAWQTKDFSQIKKTFDYKQLEEECMYSEIGI